MLAAAVAAALVSAACTSTEAGTFVNGLASPTDTSSPTGGPAPTPSRPAQQPTVSQISFQDCTSIIKPQIEDQPGGKRDLRFGCGRLSVPLDYTDPAANPIELFVLRVRLGGQRSRIGSLVVNPGGPGGSGVDAAVGLALSLPEDLLRRFDLVGFDPRGVALSSPVECISNEVKDRATALDPFAVAGSGYQAQLEVAKEIAQGCVRKYGSELAHYNTEETARDMDLVRQGVGDERLNYLGYSYGTRLGSVYADLFPKRIRAMVLDGAVNPVATEVQSAEGQAGGFENAFSQFAAACSRRGSACPLQPNPRAFVTALLDKSRGSPIPSSSAGETRRATPGNVLGAVVAALYDQEDWSKLEAALARAKDGDSSGLFELADGYNQRDDRGQYSNLVDANMAINCADSREQVSEPTVRRLAVQWRTKYPLFGTSLALGLLGCLEWTVPRHPLPVVRGVGAPPLLVIGTTNDPATPYASAQVLSRQLASAVLLTWQGDGHTAYPKTPCVTTAVDAYLISLRVSRDGTTCPAR